MLFSHSVKGRLAIGWTVGFLASIIGLTASYVFDLPTGACLVVLFGLLLLFSGVMRWFLK
jgi:ABC-type Mn2+/Zn2+ transport system permease subunit